MYRLLIVDDEMHVVDWLCDLFQEIKHIPLDIYKAYSAKSALEWLDRTRIDIVITDISMPKMDGLELMKIIRAKWPKCKVIFLTGFNEFEYTYEAIKNEAVGYILKTESDQVIVDTLEKAIEQLKEAQRIEMLVNKSEENIKQTLPLIKKEFTLKLLSGFYKNNKLGQQQLDDMEIGLSVLQPVILMLGRIDSIQDRTDTDVKSLEYFHVNLIVEKFLNQKVRIFFTPLESSHMIWFFQMPPVKNEEREEGVQIITTFDQMVVFIRDTLETVQAATRESVKTAVSFSLSNQPCHQWNNIPEMFIRLKEMLNLCTNAETLVTDKSFSIPQAINVVHSGLAFFNQQQKLDSLEVCLERGQKNDYLKLLTELTEDLKSIKSMHYNPALEIYFSISLKILSFINKRNLVEIVAFKVGMSGLMHVNEYVVWSEAVEYLFRISDAIFEIQSKQVNDMEENVIFKIKYFIEEHINEDLSLVRLAEVFFFNPSYLSRFFKQMTSVNLTEYIFEVKINKAKKLLEDRNLRIHEVATEVGFDSSTYFARFFRRISGMNPQEYRDMVNR